jgi:hypothetical protein
MQTAQNFSRRTATILERKPEETPRFKNIVIRVDATDMAEYGEAAVVTTQLEKHGIALKEIPQNALILRAVIDPQSGLLAYRIIWRLDGRPFKKKFIKEKIEMKGFVPVKFLDFIATQHTA